MRALNRRGSTIVLALLTLTVLLILGLGILGSRSAHLESSVARLRATQARQLALSGLEDVRAKLSHDYFYPPQVTEDQKVFVYSEPVLAADGTMFGLYEIRLDPSLAQDPYFLLQVRSTGFVYDQGKWVAHWIVDGEFDLSPLERPGGTSNGRLYDLNAVFDRGAF